MIKLLHITLIFLYSDGAHDKPSLLSVNPGLIIWTIIIFILLLILLRKIAWKPLIKALNNREETINAALENAEKQRKETEELLEKNKKLFAEANANSMKIINDGKEAAGKIKDDIISKANAESKKMIEQAKKEIELQKESVMEKIKDEIADVAIKAAEKIIVDNLDSKKQKKVIDEFIKKIPKN